MTPKEIFELDNLGCYHWGDTAAFWSFVYKELDEELFQSIDAKDDYRIDTLLKASAEDKSYHTERRWSHKGFSLSYWAITFDGKLVGIVVLWGKVDENWERYITNYPLYQAMVGYVRAMYTPIESSEIVGEEEEIEDLEYHYGWVIDPTEPFNMKKEER